MCSRQRPTVNTGGPSSSLFHPHVQVKAPSGKEKPSVPKHGDSIPLPKVQQLPHLHTIVVLFDHIL